MRAHGPMGPMGPMEPMGPMGPWVWIDPGSIQDRSRIAPGVPDVSADGPVDAPGNPKAHFVQQKPRFSEFWSPARDQKSGEGLSLP